jgi:predicted nucleic acid-binding protein
MGTGFVILLDTNYLIRGLIRETPEAQAIIRWLSAGEDLVACGVAWYEFLCGPVDDEGVALVQSLLGGRILPFTGDQAAEASRLFNAVDRRRSLRVDAMIAAAAIVSNAQLATGNTRDFQAFVPFGLTLMN